MDEVSFTLVLCLIAKESKQGVKILSNIVPKTNWGHLHVRGEGEGQSEKRDIYVMLFVKINKYLVIFIGWVSPCKFDAFV